MNHIEKMCRDHFNEPIILGLEVGRLVGYAEDDCDCYLIVHKPHNRGFKKVLHTAVGGYTFLNVLKDQCITHAVTGEIWTDFTRLDSELKAAGVHPVEEFQVKKQ